MFLYHRERYDELMMKSYAEAFKCVTPDDCLIVIYLITVLTDYSPHYNTCTCTCTDIVPVYMYVHSCKRVCFVSVHGSSVQLYIYYLFKSPLL